MRFTRVCIFFASVMLLSGTADGMFVWDETRKVPIDRVFTNLQQRLAQNTNDFQLTYYMARLHSMAYATNQVEIQVTKKDNFPLFNGPGWDGGVPLTVRTFADPKARALGLKHLTNAIVLYERAIILLRKSTNVNE